MNKTKFILRMANGIGVRNLEDLKKNWDMKKVKEYFQNGDMVRWLEDRQEMNIAKKLKVLPQNLDESKLKYALCKVFEMPCEELKKSLLSRYTSDENVLGKVESVAFDQEDLNDLLEEGVTDIYLCDDSFIIPVDRSGIKYNGIGSVEINIDRNEWVDFSKIGIEFSNIKFSSQYEQLIAEKNAEKEDNVEEVSNSEVKKSYNHVVFIVAALLVVTALAVWNPFAVEKSGANIGKNDVNKTLSVSHIGNSSTSKHTGDGEKKIATKVLSGSSEGKIVAGKRAYDVSNERLDITLQKRILQSIAEKQEPYAIDFARRVVKRHYGIEKADLFFLSANVYKNSKKEGKDKWDVSFAYALPQTIAQNSDSVTLKYVFVTLITKEEFNENELNVECTFYDTCYYFFKASVSGDLCRVAKAYGYWENGADCGSVDPQEFSLRGDDISHFEDRLYRFVQDARKGKFYN